MEPTPAFLPGKSHGQKSLASYSPWGHKRGVMTAQLSTWALISFRERSAHSLVPIPAMIERTIKCRLKYCWGSFCYAIFCVCFQHYQWINWGPKIPWIDLNKFSFTFAQNPDDWPRFVLLVSPLLLSCLWPLDSLLGFVAHTPFVTLEQNSCQDWHPRCELFHRSTSHLRIVISTIYHLV